MNQDVVTLFLALLAVVAEVAVVATLVLALAGRLSPGGRRLADAVRAAIGPQALTLAFLVALVSLLGSLYFSEVAHFVPCRLCWYQRICMYPLAPMLGIAAWRRDTAIRPYGATLAGIGIVISGYHMLVERYPSLETSACDPTNPCSVIWIKRFGYLTIPTMAASGFGLILCLLALARPDPVASERFA
jgi:hypothetical protein